jgi:hypothetical protein
MPLRPLVHTSTHPHSSSATRRARTVSCEKPVPSIAPIPHHPWCSHAPLRPRPSREVAAAPAHTPQPREPPALATSIAPRVVCLHCARIFAIRIPCSPPTRTRTQQPVCWLPSCVRIATPFLSHHLELFFLFIASTTLPMDVALVRLRLRV